MRQRWQRSSSAPRWNPENKLETETPQLEKKKDSIVEEVGFVWNTRVCQGDSHWKTIMNKYE